MARTPIKKTNKQISPSRQLCLPTITQPFNDPGVPLDDARWLAGSERCRTVIATVEWSAAVDRRDVGEENGTVRRAASGEHVLVAVARQAEVFEELLEMANRRFRRPPVPVAYVRLGAEYRPVALVAQALLSLEGGGRVACGTSSTLWFLAAVVRATPTVLGT